MTREEQIGLFIKKSVEGIEDSDTRTAAAITLAAGIHWADSRPHWIPVEEMLPKENEQVIAYNGVYNEIHLCDYHDGMFEDYFGPFDGTITHWMPIVPPRKEG